MTPANNSTEDLIGQFQERLDQIVLKIENSKSNPELVGKLRSRYKEMKKELYKLYLQLEDDSPELK